MWKDYLVYSDAKKSVEVIGTSGIFYAAALKCLKRDYINSLVIAHLRFKAVWSCLIKLFDQVKVVWSKWPKTVSATVENK